MELIKDYDCTIVYHPGKANVVADALSRKNLFKENRGKITLLRELKTQRVALILGLKENLSVKFQIIPTLEDQIVKAQPEDHVLRSFVEKVRNVKRVDYTFRGDGALMKEKRLFVTNNRALKESIREEVHSSACTMHPRSTKMYRTLKAYY